MASAQVDVRTRQPVPTAGATTLPPRPQQPYTEVRRRTRSIRRSDILALVGALAAAISTTALLFGLTQLSGVLGFTALAYVLFVAVYALLVSFDEDRPTVRDRLMSVLIHSCGLLLLVALVLVIAYTLFRGWDALQHLNFITEGMSGVRPLDPLTSGGVLHAVVGTLEQISIALIITIPLGITCAVFLSEMPGRFSQFVRTVVEAMTALPSIVAGLFIYATWILILGRGYSGFAASLAISVMMLPIIIRAADVVIRLVPGTLREASLALGASQWHTVWHVVLPTARSGLMTSIILGTARGIGETSPVLLTAGFTDEMRVNPLENPQVSLPLTAFNLIGRPQPDMISRGFGTAAVLLALVLLLFIVARIIGGRGAGRLSRGQLRRRSRASSRDHRRFLARAQAQASQLTEQGGRPSA